MLPGASVADYEMPDTLALTDPAQYRALFEPTRQRIVSLLLERAATVSEVAEVFSKPKGTIGHHMKVLEDAGLVHVVRTERVRALEAKYYGRTARVFLFERVGAAVGEAQRILQRASDEVGAAEKAARSAPEGESPVLDANRRDVRIPAEQAHAFQERLAELLLDFAQAPRGGSTTYALTYAIFPTSQAPLPTRGDQR